MRKSVEWIYIFSVLDIFRSLEHGCIDAESCVNDVVHGLNAQGCKISRRTSVLCSTTCISRTGRVVVYDHLSISCFLIQEKYYYYNYLS